MRSVLFKKSRLLRSNDNAFVSFMYGTPAWVIGSALMTGGVVHQVQGDAAPPPRAEMRMNAAASSGQPQASGPFSIISSTLNGGRR